MDGAMKILGIWDGHDSGAALIENDEILFAINEERLSRRKLEIAFPQKAILACLEHTQTDAKDLSEIAVSTCDFAKTLTPCFSFPQRGILLHTQKKERAGREFAI